MNREQTALCETLLPRFRDIKTPPDVRFGIVQHGPELTPAAAWALTTWAAVGMERPEIWAGVRDLGPGNVGRTLYCWTENHPAQNAFTCLAAEAGNLLGEWAAPAGLSPLTLEPEATGGLRWVFALFELAAGGQIPMKASYFALPPREARIRVDGQWVRAGFLYCSPSQTRNFCGDLRDAVRASCYAIEYLAGLSIENLNSETVTAGNLNSATPQDLAGGDMKPSDDFASMKWGTERFTFNLRQAACVCVMWEAFKNDTPMMSQEYILENAKDKYLEIVGTDAQELEGLERIPRLRDVFKAKSGTHPAWGTMIIGDSKGNFGIRPPDNPEDSHDTPT